MSDTSIEAFERHVAVAKSKRTAQTYGRGASKLHEYFDETGISEDPTEWPKTLLDDWVAWMVERDLASRTIQLMTVGARQYLDFRRKRDESIPQLEKPAIPRVVGKPPTVLGREALRAYLELVGIEETEPIRTAMLLLPLSGLRSEEMVSMKMSDITIQPDPDEDDRAWVVFSVRGKGSKHRVIPLLQQANTPLRTYLAGWRASRRQDEDWLFPGARMGRHITTRSLRDHVSSFRKRHGVDDLSPHSLRATYLTLLDRHGISSLTVAQLAGHMRPEGRAELQTLRRHYVHHNADDLMRALVRVTV